MLSLCSTPGEGRGTAAMASQPGAAGGEERRFAKRNHSHAGGVGRAGEHYRRFGGGGGGLGVPVVS